jgi:hypothetical protein
MKKIRGYLIVFAIGFVIGLVLSGRISCIPGIMG